ncbi:replication-relaxation family protein [Candidatus Saccharibacteria bacterium]|nr:replication-relaxation family protein [Candidatus Saccharibacteria bacterium]
MPQVTNLSLTKQQQAILHELYRFRFLNSSLLVKLLGTSNVIRMNERLKLLSQNKYISRRYEPSYKLLHKPASYYLLPLGRASLKAMDAKYSEQALRIARRDATRTDKFIERCLALAELAVLLTAPHTKVFTKSQLVRYGYFPQPLPDLYIQLKTNSGVQQYLLEYLESNQPLNAILKSVKRYLQYSDEGEWEVTGTRLPPVLLVCDSALLEKRVQKYGMTVIEEADDEVLRFYTACIPAITDKANRPWTSLQDLDEQLELKEIR